ncbi:caspase family protein [Aliiruegeria sabulilitoris]|uniref:caspase family protein n=1 Tax=Aliiruegeria sabulilitoris TaxID=1510458 RepID=UPI0008306D10|nr:caspase family protein [Aliiruegeria sabulilitoris]
MLRGVLAITIFLVATSLASAEGRYALLIGNADYATVEDLKNTKNDARDLGLVFSKLGYDVTVLYDLSRAEMVQTLGEFRRRTHGADHAIIYYAGHGVEIDRENFLIPVDAVLKTDLDIKYETVPLELLSDSTAGASDLSLVILDACRNNPFIAAMTRSWSTRSLGRGLAEVEPTAHSLVAFAAREGTVAQDGVGRNGPYAKALMEVLALPGVEINFVFRMVHDRVLEATMHRQQPHIYGALSSRLIYIHPPETAAQEPEEALELALWREVSSGGTEAEYRAYLEAFPNGAFADVARIRLKALSGSGESGQDLLEASLPEVQDGVSSGAAGSLDAPAQSDIMPARTSGNSAAGAGFQQEPDATASKDTDRSGQSGTTPHLLPDPTALASARRPGLESVETCFRGASAQAGGSKILVEVAIDLDGDVADLPTLLEPSDPSPSDRALFVKLASALDKCAPYAVPRAGRYRLSTSGGAVHLLDGLADGSGGSATKRVGLKLVAACFEPPSGYAGGKDVVVEVEIDAAGNVADLPRLLAPREPTSSDRALFVKLASALDKCAPYRASGPGLYRLHTGGGAIRLLESR